MARDIETRKFSEEDLQAVYQLIQRTIDISYHEAYPEEAVEFFKNHHRKEEILNETATGYTVVAESNNELVGTGTLLGLHIVRVFVNPLHQHRGIGKIIVQELEREALVDKPATLYLEASLVSRQFWESLGYIIQSEDFIPVGYNQKLKFYRMAKTLSVIS
ncbi:MAG: GNAT family N-acetyltransferase [Dehalococcoidales bacterium]|nr:MAG: GNAT family N-acetyltransferase [Dehalococcoidales bacterium]